MANEKKIQNQSIGLSILIGHRFFDRTDLRSTLFNYIEARNARYDNEFLPRDIDRRKVDSVKLTALLDQIAKLSSMDQEKLALNSVLISDLSVYYGDPTHSESFANLRGIKKAERGNGEIIAAAIQFDIEPDCSMALVKCEMAQNVVNGLSSKIASKKKESNPDNEILGKMARARFLAASTWSSNAAVLQKCPNFNKKARELMREALQAVEDFAVPTGEGNSPEDEKDIDESKESLKKMRARQNKVDK